MASEWGGQWPMLSRPMDRKDDDELARQSDKRSHLDLQIDLLAEREMMAMLQLLQDIDPALTRQCPSCGLHDTSVIE
jgi:hypothetical protein